LNQRFNTAFEAFKAIDIFNTGNVNECNFKAALRGLNLTEYESEFNAITNGNKFMRLADLLAYLKNGTVKPQIINFYKSIESVIST